MYHYVTDKEYLKQSYSICADIVNQLVQRLKQEDVDAEMFTAGSKKRGLVTQNEKGPIDYDFNLMILNPDDYHSDSLKEIIRRAFNEVLNRNGWGDCQDSTSVLTTEQRVLKKGNKTPFSIDVAIVREDSMGNLHRLIHRKTGCVVYDQWYWNIAPNSRNLWEKEDYLKPDYWLDVRERYLDKKNMYLTRNDDDHSSFICYIEALNEVYTEVRKKKEMWY